MSGVQGGGCHFNSQMISLMNFKRPTECRYDMRHVVAYVVADVVLVWGVDVCFGRLQTWCATRFGRQWPSLTWNRPLHPAAAGKNTLLPKRRRPFSIVHSSTRQAPGVFIAWACLSLLLQSGVALRRGRSNS